MPNEGIQIIDLGVQLESQFIANLFVFIHEPGSFFGRFNVGGLLDV